MFQNISGQVDAEKIDDLKQENNKKLFSNMFTKQNIIIYILSTMVSMVSCGGNMAPFGLAMLAAISSNGMPVGIVYLCTLIGSFIGFGGQGLLNYVLTSLIFIAMILIFKPKYKQIEERRLRLGKFIFASVCIVELGKMFFKGFMIYDLMVALAISLTTYIFYKIFANSINVIKDMGIKKAFSIEEVVGACVILSIATAAFGNLSIFGLEIRNIISILIVMILGWKNGILLGATTGVTIGSIMGIVTQADPTLIAAFAISGMIAGIFNKLGKVGVIIGFFAGTVLLTYIANGNTIQIIYFKEILVASLGLLLVPKNIEIDLKEFFSKSKCLPTNSKYALEENTETIYKLNNVSETIKEMSDTYKEVAATVVEDEEIINQNKELFINELQNRLESVKQNILFEEIAYAEENFLNELFYLLTKKRRNIN